jgi:hypothetical protein
VLVGWAFLCGTPNARAADADSYVSLWIIPPGESEPNDIAQGEDIPSRMRALRVSLTGTRGPGNIRELEHFIERSVILSSGNVLCAPLADPQGKPPRQNTWRQLR